MGIFTTTIGDILAGFEKTIDELDKLVERNRSKVVVHSDRIMGLKDKNIDLIADSNKAENVARKLRDLIAE